MVSSNSIEVVSELLPILKVYKDGTVERFLNSPYAPPSPLGNTTGVLSKDIAITPDISARLYLPKLSPSANQKLPILVYFHGGGFCIESPFSILCHRYLNLLVSQSKIIVVSVDYRLAPEYPLPVAYEDSWAALQWVASHNTTTKNTKEDPWLIRHGNFDRLYLGGDSSGANIAHNIAMQAGTDTLHGDTKIHGVFLSQPYFCGSKLIGNESLAEKRLLQDTWMLVYPNAKGGIDNPMINPFAYGSRNLSQIQCRRLFVCVASKDELRERGVYYYKAVKESGWKGQVELFKVEGEGHGFHFFDFDSEKAKELVNRLASFLC
ncbi:2-hydroxyisoflavanone dehydratase-like [Apium graveolens]|uniref:2-hydroxyisoflavanone dehydratase-like n=1 Tax=Apium graveolens TaxID=4045 RepID=UPI003D78EB47